MTTRRPPADGPGSPGLPWHVSDALARRYADGSAAETDAWSLEKHVEACTDCAGRVSAAVRAGTAGPVLASVRAELLASLEPGRAPADARTAHPASSDLRTPPAATRLGRRFALGASEASGGSIASGASGASAASGTSAAFTASGASSTTGPSGTPSGPGASGTTGTSGTPSRPGASGASGASSSPGTSAPSSRRRSTAATLLGRRPEPALSAGHRPSPGARTASAAYAPRTPTPLGRWARLWWAVGPALRGSWLVAVLLVVGGAFGLAHGAGVQEARGLLLALSPVLPLAGVAVSYGRHADPMYEITTATPSGGLRLLLTRTAAVLAVCVPLLTAGGALLPPVAGFPGAAAWLLPGLALTLATLALGSFVGCRAAAATLGGGWLLAVTGPLLGPADTAASATALAPYFSGPAAQGGWAAAAVACAALLALRRRSFDHLESR
ncbi:zf-HC2 domain-containing protein [Streptomyces sp. NPDC057680]|uniref:zf-HC2 domain-containing protein n=1 Tax=Streptomyces sp. NPDC057680 TaxID=3346208 RepID=UPI0036B2319C